MGTSYTSFEQQGNSKQDFQYCKRYHHRGVGHPFLGIILVLAGVIFLAKNFNWLSEETTHILISWPMLLIVLGLLNLVRRAYTTGLIFLAAGTFFLIPRITDVPYDLYQNFWPIVLIIFGILFIFRRKHSPHHWRQHGFTNESVNADTLNEEAIFSGRKITIVNDNFAGGKITSVFGGTTVNLLNAKTAPGCTVELENVFGGTKFIVPEDWDIKVEASLVFGGFEDRRNAALIARNDPSKTMIIKGSCVFGGGEITSAL